jgi:hypothetical protein
MKLLIITCITEDQKQVMNILKKEGVNVYSTISASEFDENQPNNLKDGWFALEKEQFNSTILVCFTSDDKAEATYAHINKHNQSFCLDDKSPIKAHIIAVEKSNLE